MVDDIQLNKILPSLSPAAKVKPVDQRRRSDQQNPFEEPKKKRRKKKKKENAGSANMSDSDHATDDGQHTSHVDRGDADKGEKTMDSSPSKKIDIRV